jgi:hypothetical protein
MRGARQQSRRVLASEVRDELADAGQMESTILQHLQDQRVLPGGSACADPQVGLGLGEMEDLRAVREHRRRGFARVEPALLDFSDVRDQVGLDPARVTEQRGQATKDIVVREMGKAKFVSHGRIVRLTQDREGPIRGDE